MKTRNIYRHCYGTTSIEVLYSTATWIEFPLTGTPCQKENCTLRD